MPEPSEREDPTALQRLRAIATEHYTELTKLAERYNRLADQVNGLGLGLGWRVAKYSISEYLDRIANSGTLTVHPQSSKTIDVYEARTQSLTVYRTDALKMFAFDD